MNEIISAGNYGEVRDGHLFGPGPGGVASHPAVQGFAAAGRSRSMEHKRRVNEAVRLYSDAIQGRIPPFLLQQAVNPTHEFAVMEIAKRYPGIYGDPGGRMLGLRETMSRTDYQALYVDVLDRLYYGFYNGYPVVNKGLVRMHDLRDFRLVSRYLLDGMVTPLTGVDPAAPPQQRALVGPSPQNGAYPTTNTAPIQYQPKLYHAMASVNWAAFVNDDLGIFQDRAKRLALAANRGISKFITSLYVDANGPNASLYTSGANSYNNIINTANGAATNNPALSSQGIMDALKVLARQRDSGGDPILITGKLRLWYGPRYVALAENLMAATSMQLSVEGGTQNTQGFPTQFLQANNWLIRNMELVMDPYIPIVCTTSGTQDTMWGITVDPDSVERPSIEMGFLTGFKEPQMFQKVGNTARMGGAVDPMMGDFISMDSDIKVVTVFGGTQIDGRTTVASTGQGV
jgi:hypothetical protein